MGMWIVEGIDEDLEDITWKRWHYQHEPLGLKIVDDVIHTVADNQITRYHDLNDDGEANYHETSTTTGILRAASMHFA